MKLRSLITSVGYVGFSYILVTLVSCGKSSVTETSYQSCSSTGTLAGASFCVEAANAASMKESCTTANYPGAVYAERACEVSAGARGCKWKNSNLVEVTEWYTGIAWSTPDGIASAQNSCSTKQGTLITK
jgi:hypothetical protein